MICPLGKIQNNFHFSFAGIDVAKILCDKGLAVVPAVKAVSSESDVEVEVAQSRKDKVDVSAKEVTIHVAPKPVTPSPAVLPEASVFKYVLS